MPSEASSEARRISARLVELGLQAPPSRVQYWIDHGLLGPLNQYWPGGGGSQTELPRDAVDVAALLACLPRQARHYHELVLARFARGLEVHEDELHFALGVLVDEVFDFIGLEDLVGADEDTVMEAAQARAQKVVASRRRSPSEKLWRARLREWASASEDVELRSASGDELHRLALTPLFAAFSGDASHLEGQMEPIIAAAGFRDVAALTSKSRPELLADMDDTAKVAMFIIQALRATAADGTMDEFRAARRLSLSFLRLSQDTEVLDLLEGRAFRPWGHLHTGVAGGCLPVVALAHYGLIDLPAWIQEVEAGMFATGS